MSRFRISTQVARDIEDIWKYLAPNNLQQFFIKPATKINSKTKPSIGFSTFIRGAFDCDLL